MLDAKTITATLTLALLSGCTSKPAESPESEQPPVTHAPADMPADSAAPADSAPTDMTTNPDAPKAEPPKADAAPALPGGRTEPLPPKDHKPVASKEASKRTGSMACCGAGTCGECAPLPAKRAEPKPPKDGKAVTTPSKSARKGKEACCGEGTCSPC